MYKSEYCQTESVAMTATERVVLLIQEREKYALYWSRHMEACFQLLVALKFMDI